jgi:hypothetical protein
MGTSVVHRISIHATAETALPTPPVLGANYVQATLSAAGWFTIGSRANGDDADIDSESIDVTPIHEGVTVRPAGSLAAQRYITRHAGIDEVTFTAYDLDEDVWELDSNMDVTSNVAERTATQTNRAMMIERDGICVEYYPNIVLHIVGEPGGYGPGDDAVSKLEFRAKVLQGDDIPSGQQVTFYQAGT